MRCAAKRPDVSSIRIRIVANNAGCSFWTESLHHCPIRSVRNRWDSAPQRTEILVVSCDWSNRCCCRYSLRRPTCTMPNFSNTHWRIALQARTVIAWCRLVLLDRIAIASLWYAADDCTGRPAGIVCFAANWHDESRSMARGCDRLSLNMQRWWQIENKIRIKFILNEFWRVRDELLTHLCDSVRRLHLFRPVLDALLHPANL